MVGKGFDESESPADALEFLKGPFQGEARKTPADAVPWPHDVLRVWREDPRAKLPVRSHPTDSGLDLTSIETRTLRPGQRHLFDVGLRLALPTGYEGQVRPRSGLAVKHGITVLNAPGTIDDHYRGRVKVVLLNTSDAPFQIEEGMRIAQLVIAPVAIFNPVEVKDASGLGETDRGERGFGSSGN